MYFHCPECPFQCRNLKEFVKHSFVTHQESKQFFAKVYSRRTKPEDVTEEVLVSNITQQAVNKMIQCDQVWTCSQCSRTFPTLVTLSKHFNSKLHRDVTKRHQCPKCSKTFARGNALKHHIDVIHLEQKLTCEHCGMLFHQSRLTTHIKLHHQSENSEHYSDVLYGCDSCDFKARTKKYVKSHMFRQHSTEQHKHVCNLCNTKFPYPFYLKEHQNLVHKIHQS